MSNKLDFNLEPVVRRLKGLGYGGEIIKEDNNMTTSLHSPNIIYYMDIQVLSRKLYNPYRKHGNHIQ